MKKNCLDRVGLSNGSRLDADIVSLIQGDDNFFKRKIESSIRYVCFTTIDDIMFA